jgi:hypothetical protein
MARAPRQDVGRALGTDSRLERAETVPISNEPVARSLDDEQLRAILQLSTFAVGVWALAVSARACL